MASYVRFLGTGLVLGLYTEVQLKLVAEVKPSSFVVAVFVHPILLTLSYSASRVIDRAVSSTWRGDLLHYTMAGVGGLAFEWVVLGNGPGSNAIQLGMFAMWTTFCFGPRILIRAAPSTAGARREFWTAFVATSAVLSALVLLAPNQKAKLVIAVLGLTVTYTTWTIWLLVLAWRGRRKTCIDQAETA